MPDKKMDKKALLVYKKLLTKIKEETLRDIKQMSSDNSVAQKDVSGDVSGHALHMADVATDMYDREFNMGLASNEREVLLKIEQALKRIEDKTFGLCTECNKPIAAARLKAIAYVDTCLKCQEKLESHKK